jgi:hypothetical protein
MHVSLGYFDLPLLLGQGFKFGIADSILWGKDTKGTEYQAVVDGQWLYFAERLPAGNTTSLKRMGRDDFHAKFMNPPDDHFA